MERYDVTIIGGGILGTTLAYWLASLYEGRIALIEMEDRVAPHTSGRNTGVIHRPFYLDPEKRKIFARTAQVSYYLWKDYARARRLPWREIGTIEIASEEKQLKTLEKYVRWSRENGMREGEVLYLTPAEVKKQEPEVECLGAIFATTDTSVDYGAFTEAVRKEAEAAGARFLLGFEAGRIIREKERLLIASKDGRLSVESRFLVNCAGGNSIDIAHQFGLALDYTDLHFRGEYWRVDDRKAGIIKSNIYTVPKHPDIPFLDPHWIVRSTGKVEIGPNAVLVAGPFTYSGFFNGPGELLAKMCERPLSNKLRLFTNPDFLKLASEEWLSSLSRRRMVSRVKRFIPSLSISDLVGRGTGGVRSSLIDSGGRFIKEALEFPGHLSYHVTNYNSPGATGAPAYTALLAHKLAERGDLSHLRKRTVPSAGVWNHGEVMRQVLA